MVVRDETFPRYQEEARWVRINRRGSRGLGGAHTIIMPTRGKPFRGYCERSRLASRDRQMVDGPIGDPARTPVVFVPGMLGDDRLWQLQAERLADVADPVNGASLDRRWTFGARGVPSMRRFALAGLSMGGYVALEVVRVAPDRVAPHPPRPLGQVRHTRAYRRPARVDRARKRGVSSWSHAACS